MRCASSGILAKEVVGHVARQLRLKLRVEELLSTAGSAQVRTLLCRGLALVAVVAFGKVSESRTRGELGGISFFRHFWQVVLGVALERPP